jgi:fermentation-respiration switch protein FrsA (DUF1100 family)
MPSKSRPTRRLFGSKSLVAVMLTGALLASGCVMLESKERELTWRPSRTSARWFGGLPAGVQDVALPVAHGSTAAWWWPAAQADAPTLLYLHGARWNLTGQLHRIEQLHDFGFSVLAIEYRGFGKDDGEPPSEATAYEDAEAGWRWVAAHEPNPERRFVYGHSLGGAVAVELARRISVGADAPGAGLIIESTFTSLADTAAAMSYEWLPVGLILSQKFDSLAKMAEVRMPVLVVHGADDHYVPARFSKALFKAARGPKKLLLIDGAGHNNTMWVGADEYRSALTELFGVREPDAAPAPDQNATRTPRSSRGG